MIGKTSDVGGAEEQKKHKVAAESAEGLKKKFHDLKVCGTVAGVAERVSAMLNSRYMQLKTSLTLSGRRCTFEASSGQVPESGQQQPSPR